MNDRWLTVYLNPSSMAASLVLSAFKSVLTCPRDCFSDIGTRIPLPSFEAADIIKLCDEAFASFSCQPALIRLDGPVIVVGDLHGQFFDLIRIFHCIDNFLECKFLFLGDYVDRGEFSTETMILLIALAIMFPKNFILLRGNHEFKSVNVVYGFKTEIMGLYGNLEVWEAFNHAFTSFPIAALINRDILCVHAGISQNLASINEIDRVIKPIQEFDQYIFLNDVMWSDPTGSPGEYELSNRGIIFNYGQTVFEEFLELNKLKMLIRGHQFQQNGVGYLYKNKCCTVFSASNYCENRNFAAIITIDSTGKIQEYYLDVLLVPKRENVVFESTKKIPNVITLSSIAKTSHIKSATLLVKYSKAGSMNINKMSKWTTIKKDKIQPKIPYNAFRRSYDDVVHLPKNIFCNNRKVDFY